MEINKLLNSDDALFVSNSMIERMINILGRFYSNVRYFLKILDTDEEIGFSDVWQYIKSVLNGPSYLYYLIEFFHYWVYCYGWNDVLCYNCLLHLAEDEELMTTCS